MLIKKANYSNKKERIEMAALHLARLFDMLVFFLSLSYLSSSLYGKLLFGGWFEKDD